MCRSTVCSQKIFIFKIQPLEGNSQTTTIRIEFNFSFVNLFNCLPSCCCFSWLKNDLFRQRLKYYFFVGILKLYNQYTEQRKKEKKTFFCVMKFINVPIFPYAFVFFIFIIVGFLSAVRILKYFESSFELFVHVKLYPTIGLLPVWYSLFKILRLTFFTTLIKKKPFGNKRKNE